MRLGGPTPILRHRLTLERIAAAPDGGGGVLKSWASAGTLWAEIKPASAKTVVAGLRPSARVTHRVSVRNAPEGSPRRPGAEDRFRQGTRLFVILGVTEAGPSGAWLVCWVEEGAYS